MIRRQWLRTRVARALISTGYACVILVSAATSARESMEWPAVGYITHAPVRFGEKVRTPLCTGTLIAPRVVLTAAHCFDRRRPGFAFGVGNYTERARVTRGRVIIHPRYESERDLAYDVAYLVLTTGVPEVTPMPVRLAAHMESCDYESVGYGVSKDGYEITADGLVDGEDLGERKLLTLCADADYVPERHNAIRARSVSAAICAGDSGGPLIYEPTGELVGVASNIASRNCGSGRPAYYQPTATHVDFIRRALAAGSGPDPRRSETRSLVPRSATAEDRRHGLTRRHRAGSSNNHGRSVIDVHGISLWSATRCVRLRGHGMHERVRSR